jgi:pSer/pThr/pTyr-binding forkhead associated (FHA) protein
MRTMAIAKVDTKFPWLERYSPSSSAPEVIAVHEFPFTLGRGDDCDCQIPSNRVSREHAEIQRTSNGYVIRDLGSTNGTLVNGQRADKTRLEDGDLILIADIELTFHVGNEAEPRRMATQLMPDDDQRGDEPQVNVARQTIHEIRTWHERLLCRGTRGQFQILVDLASGKTAGFESIPASAARREETRASHQRLAGTDCRLTERMHQLERLLATELAAQLPEGELLFLRLEAAEVGADSIPTSLARMQNACASKRIVVAIPDSAVVDIPYFHDFLARLHDLGLKTAYFNFAGNQQQVITNQKLAPDYLMLAPLLARGVDKSSQRQQQIRTIVESAKEGSACVIATGIHSALDAQACRELGCVLAQGEHYGFSQIGECTADS